MKNVINGEIKQLLSQKGPGCISVILPLQKLPSDGKQNLITINNTLDNILTLIAAQYQPPVSNQLATAVLEMRKAINLSKGIEGVGLFISPGLTKLVEFPFPVKEKVSLGNSFEIRDVVYKYSHLQDYLLLMLNNGTVHLKRGSGDTLEEISDGNFPAAFSDNYEYNSPGQANAPTIGTHMVEKDKSVMQQIRSQDFFKSIDEKLKGYLVNHTPLVVAGVSKNLGYFEKLTRHSDHIVGTLPGSYDHDNDNQLKPRVWTVIKEYRDSNQEEIIRAAREMDPGMFSTGIQSVWTDAYLGKGLRLLVERDFTQPGFVGEGELNLALSVPEGEHRILSDAVDDIIETVLEREGDVMFVENGKLEEFGRIGLIKRFV
jgi:hypothetical protein